MTLDRSASKWAVFAALVAGSFGAAAPANAEVNWSIGIGGPVYYAPAPVYTPPPVYYRPAPRTYYRPPPPVYFPPAPVYYGAPPPVYYGAPPPVYYGPDYRSGYRYRGRRDQDDRDD